MNDQPNKLGFYLDCKIDKIRHELELLFPSDNSQCTHDTTTQPFESFVRLSEDDVGVDLSVSS